MFRLNAFHLAKLRLWLLLLLVCCGLGQYQQIKAEQIYATLYNSNDRVQMVSIKDFDAHAYGNPKSTLVQFINSFCGDCRRFSPIFKKLALQLYDWESILQILVVDCAQEINVKLCRHFGIKSVPTLRYLTPRYEQATDAVGASINTLEPSEIREILAERLAEIDSYALDGPNFKHVSSVTSALQDKAEHQLLALIVEDLTANTTGRDAILELLRWPMVKLRLISDTSVGAPEEPKLLKGHVNLVNARLENTPLKVPEPLSGKSYAKTLIEHLRSKNYTPTPTKPTIAMPKMNATLEADVLNIINTVKKSKGTVYRADLEQAVDMILHVEFPRAKLIADDSFKALKLMLNILVDHHPLNYKGGAMLKELFYNVSATNGSLTGEEFESMVKSVDAKHTGIFKARRYVGCVGSKPLLRGFTCSLWTLFHYLTVKAAPHVPPGEVLVAIHGFVKHFFGCTNCVEHFLGMAERRHLFDVADNDEAILWLWEAHNEVNVRLAGDTTEDPVFPKIKYPSAKDCPKCHFVGLIPWRRDEVLKYLKRIYRDSAVSPYGLPNTSGYD